MNVTAYAQNRPHIIYTEKDGLLSNDVYGIVQDDRGFIWITTKVGINRFDGKEFIDFTVFDGLPTNFSWRLFHDSQDRIWLFNNLTPFTYIKNDSIYRVGHKIDNFYLQSIVEDSEGNIHFNQDRKGGNRFVFTRKGELFEKDKSWYLGKKNDLNYYYSGRSIAIRSESDAIINMPNDDLIGQNHFAFTQKEIVFISTKKIISFNLKTHHFKIIKNNILANTFVTINQYKNNVIIGSKKGYFLFDGNVLNQIDSTLFISHLLIDKNKNNWFPSLGGGLYFYPKLPRNVLNYPDNQSRGFFLNKVDTSVYVSNAKADFYQINKQKKNIYSFLEINALTKILHHKNTLFLFKSNRLFIFPDQLKNNPKRIDQSDTSFVLDKAYELLTGNGTRDYCIQYNKILLATTHGLVLLEFIKGKSLSIVALTKNRTLSCYLNGKTILYGNETGLYKVINGVETQIFETEITDGSIKTIKYFEHLESYFVGTEQGSLYKISENLQDIYKYDLLFNQIKHIALKNENILLISTSDKLIEFNVTTENVINNIGANQGLLSNDILESVYFDSTFYILTSGGLSIINDKVKGNQTNTYPTHIKSIYVDNIKVKNTKDLLLPTSSRHLKIEFTNLTYWGNSNIEYSYKIDRIKSAWVTTNTPSVEFVDFPYGEHTFLLKSIGYDGKERPEILKLNIIKPFPFWLRTWFILLMILIGILTVVLIMRYVFLRKVNNVKIEQEKVLLKNKTALAEYKALRLQMNPHFLFNSLNIVQNSILDGDVEEANTYLNEFAVLMRQILQFSTKDKIKLSQEIDLNKHYLKIEKNRYRNTIDVRIEIDERINLDTIMVPPMIFQPMLENAIWHGIVPLNTNGKITLEILKEKKYLKVIITDNGIGYKRSLENPKKHRKRDSIAIENTNDRLRYFDKSENKLNRYITIADAENRGTKVILFIYIKTAINEI